MTTPTAPTRAEIDKDILKNPIFSRRKLIDNIISLRRGLRDISTSQYASTQIILMAEDIIDESEKIKDVSDEDNTEKIILGYNKAIIRIYESLGLGCGMGGIDGENGGDSADVICAEIDRLKSTKLILSTVEVDEAIAWAKTQIERIDQEEDSGTHLLLIETKTFLERLIQAAKSGEPSGDDRWCSEDSPEVLRARAMGFKVKVGKHKSVWFEDDLGRMSEQAFWSQRELVFYMNGFDAAKYGGKAP